MEIKATREQLDKIKLYIGIPAYGNQIAGHFSQSLLRLDRRLNELGIARENVVVGNESLITRGRNKLVNGFLHSDCTHLLFLDADLGFNEEDILAMLFLDFDLCGLPYATKAINWDRVKRAVEAGVPASELSKFTSYMAFNTFDSEKSFPLDEPLKVYNVATGLMLIKRRVFEKMIEAHPEWEYKLMPGENQEGWNTQFEFFRVGVDPSTKYYLSEDYQFCQDWRDLGGDVYLLPWAITNHVGSYPFLCDMGTVAKAGVAL